MHWIFRSAAAGLALLAADAAQAQSPPPFGYWEAEGGGQALNWSNDGACSFAANGTVTNGVCDWNPTSGGGILTLTYPWTLEPGHIYLNVVWQDEQTIVIEGFVFRKRG